MLRIANMNKGVRKKQSILRNKWYEENGVHIAHPIAFHDAQDTIIPKKI